MEGRLPALDDRAPGGLDEAAGRTDRREVLRRRLASAPPRYLRGALDNPELSPGELGLLLRNRQAPGTLLAELGSDRRWLRHYRVRRLLALHPRTPLAIARDQVRHLYWRELVEVSTVPHVNPVVRRHAERRLAERLDGLALGERVNIARRAGRGVIPELGRSDETPVLRALLENPRLVEADVVALTSQETAPREFLGRMSEHPRWGRRREVLVALAANPRTPVAAAMRAVHTLPPRDLGTLRRNPRVPRIVRVGAERRLEALAAARRPDRIELENCP